LRGIVFLPFFCGLGSCILFFRYLTDPITSLISCKIFLTLPADTFALSRLNGFAPLSREEFSGFLFFFSFDVVDPVFPSWENLPPSFSFRYSYEMIF